MISSSLVILADRGNVKAYAIEQGILRKTARLVLERRIEEAHGRFRDKVTDQAGAFATGGGGNYSSMAEGERGGMEEEEDRRIFHQLADHINAILREHAGSGWAFAAPAEINAAVLAHVEPAFRERLEKNLGNDLVKTPADEILEHFSKAD